MPRKYTYAEMREMGLCVTCGKVNPTPEFARCPECTRKRKENRKKNREYYEKIGYCTRCGQRKAEPNKHLCLECLWKIQDQYYKDRENHNDKLLKKSRRSYERAKEKGYCSSCKARKATIGVYCNRCYAKQIRYKESRREDIARAERVSFGRCYICGETAIEGKGVCEKCYETRTRAIHIAIDAAKNSENNYFRKMNDSFWKEKKKYAEEV